MARVSFSALIESIVGKLAGSVFQDSYGGFQIRTRVSPRNPSSHYQQLRRGEFAFISRGWKALTPEQRETWIDAGGDIAGGLQQYISTNVNLSLIEQTLVQNYEASDPPPAFPISLSDSTQDSLYIKAAGVDTMVPPQHTLLIQATYQKDPQKLFTNDSQYSPIFIFGEYSQLSIAYDIFSGWADRFGQAVEGKKIQVKANLINNFNGQRGETSTASIITGTSMTCLYAATVSQSGTTAPTVTEQKNLLGGITWYYNGNGSYSGLTDNVIDVNMMFLIIPSLTAINPFFQATFRYNGTNEVVIETANTAGAQANDLLTEGYIYIFRV